MKTPEQIALATDEYAGQTNIRVINAAFRAQDDSHLWPICGRFNATERAIRRARELQHAYGPVYGLEYALLLDSIIREIVNREE